MRVVPIDTFIDKAVLRAAELSNITDDRVIYKLVEILRAMCFERGDGEYYIDLDDATNFLRNFVLALEEGDGRFLSIRRGLCVDRIVDVEEFVCSREYLDLKMVIRPKWLELLIELHHGDHSDEYIEVGLGGAIGTGKSFFSFVSMAYDLYKLSCYHSPQLEFKMSPGASIMFSMQSVRLEQAKKVLFNQFKEHVYRSKYFTQNFPFDPTVESELRFPHNITVLPISSSDTAALGYNIYSSIIDEISFLARVRDSKRVIGTTEDEYDQAKKLYNTALRRIESRFKIAGRVPGKLYLISSANYPGDFMDEKRKEAEEQKRSGSRRTIFFVKLARWEAFPPGTFSDETFLVEVGNATKKSRIIDSIEDAVDPNDVIKVPVDFRDDFERDLEGAIRDIAGEVVGGGDSFIKQRETIVKAVDMHKGLFEGSQLFLKDKIVMYPDAFNPKELVSRYFLEKLPDKSAPLVAHVDMGLVADSCGVAVGHIAGYQYVGKVFNWSQEEGRYIEVPGGHFPVVVIDGLLEITNAAGDEIDIGLVGDLLLTIASMTNLTVVTADRFQSVALLQKMRKTRNAFGRRIKSTILSVDTSLAPYMELKQGLRDQRILFPDVEKVQDELRSLVLDPKRMKVDHPPGGSKDLADAMAGVVYSSIYLTKRHKRRDSRRLRRGEMQESQQQESTTKQRPIRRIHT